MLTVSELYETQSLSLWSCTLTMSVGHGCFLFCDAWTLRCHFGVQLFVGGPFRWQIVFVEDGRDWTLRNTRLAVNAFIRVNEQNRFTFIKTLYWTYDHAVSVFAVKAWFGDNMSH